MVDYQTFSIVLTGIGLIIALTYYALQIRNQNRTRQTQLFMDIYNNHISIPNFTALLEMMWEWDWETFDDFIAKYSILNNKEAHVKWGRYFASLEGLGILCKKGLIDPELVYDSQYLSIINIWEKFQPIIEEYRLRLNAPQMYGDPEYLYKEMIRMRAEKEHEAAKVSLDLFTNNP